eukprot:SRR837773.21582.p2 GENE.SRR837773.21582~~SRR837773.21582.p2  ORF type:complete len:345 (+),score=153.63 SRR837773.21582:155-1036(+)
MGTWSGSYKDCKTGDATCAEQHARFSVDTWLHIGGTHIDGANDYRTQTAIADSLRSSGVPREEIFLTTKCPGAIGYEAIMQCADDNLQMLGHYGSYGVGYIDLLLVHFPFTMKPACRFSRELPECKAPNVPYVPASKEQLQDTWRAMEELKRIGVVKAIGLSDYNITNLQDTLEVATMPIDVHQVEWNPTDHDEAMLAFCQKNGIQLQAWSPLGGSKGSVLSHPTVEKIAKAHNKSTAQVTLRWSLQRNVIVVVGTANPDHEQGDISLFDFELTPDEVKAIDAIQGEHKAMII